MGDQEQLAGLEGLVIKFPLRIFDPEEISWTGWVQLFAEFCRSNNVPPEPPVVPPALVAPHNARRSAFLQHIGPRAFEHLRIACLPMEPRTQGLPTLCALLKQKYEPQGMATLNRVQFNQRCQRQGESASDFIAALQVLASKCGFGPMYFDNLRDRIVTGLRSNELRMKLLGTDDLTYPVARQIVLQDEALRTETRILAQSQTVNFVSRKKNRSNGSPHAKPSHSNSSQHQQSSHNSNQKPSSSPNAKWNPCFRCTRRHDGRTCPAINWTCHACGAKGHIAKASSCPKRNNRPRNQSRPPVVNEVSSARNQPVNNSQSLDEEVAKYIQVSQDIQVVLINEVSQSPPLYSSVMINGKPIEMEVDTGAGVSLVSLPVYQNHLNFMPLSPAQITLRSVSGVIKVYGQISVSASIRTHSCSDLILYVCEAVSPVRSLLGRPWLDALLPQWRNLFSVPVYHTVLSIEERVAHFANMFPNVFDVNNDSPISQFKATLILKDNVQDKFASAYSLPYALIDVIGDLIDKLVKSSKVFSVEYSTNASPCVPIKKKSGGYRLCVDFKRTLNTQLHVNQYPLPKIDDIFASLAYASCFTVIDLSDAYLQLELDEPSKPYVTANTHKGLFRYNRLIYGISSAPSIFQQTVESILKGVPGVKSYLDDILVYGKDFDECYERTVMVLRKLSSFNVKANISKCQWFVHKVEYLGNVLSKEGRKPSPAKMEAVLKARKPQNKSQVSTYLGLFSYYLPFLPEFSAVSKPLREMSDPLVWTPSANAAFDNCKKLLAKSGVLIHYNPDLPIVVICDASPDGLGAILCHEIVDENGYVTERPIFFASCALTVTQQNYSQIDREALAIMFAIRKFFKYLWGRHFKLVTDNAPLKHILSPEKSIPVLSAQRLQHWSYILQAYDFEIVHRSGKLLSHVDALSRSPSDEFGPDDLEVCATISDDLPLNSAVIAEESKKDSVLQPVMLQTKIGWPDVPKYLSELVKPFFKLREQLSLEKGCLLYESRVVIPESLQAKVLQILHEGHAGIVRMKMLARSTVWWFQLSTDIESKCNLCNSCSMINFKRSHDYVPWPEAKFVFERIHIDFATLYSKHYFVIADSYSKWIHVQRMSSCKAIDVIVVLTTVFGIFGDCMSIMSDNGQPFDSAEYMDFCTSRDIIAVHSPAYHAESNGCAERAVQITKRALEKLLLDANTGKSASDSQCDIIVNKFLMSYRNTPTTTTLKSPNELLLSFKPITQLSRLLPNIVSDSPRKSEFRDGESVVVKLSKRHPPVKGNVVRRLGPTRYLVSFQGVLRKPHINQMNHAIDLVQCINFAAVNL